MNDRIIRILASIELIAFSVSLLLAVIMGGCSTPVELASGSTMPMKCHWTFVAVSSVSVIGIVLSACILIFRDKKITYALTIALVFTMVVIGFLVSDYGIGVCTHSDAHCRTTMNAILACCLVGLVCSIPLQRKARRKEEGADVPPKTV